MKKITLMLMTKKAHRLLADNVDEFGGMFERVIVGRDKSLHDDYSEQIVELCESRGILWTERTPHDVVRSDYAIAVGWRWLVNFPQDRLIIFHDSLLPKYRGFNPLVTSLINGDHRIGVSVLFGAKQFDAGPIITQMSAEITYPCSIAAAIDKVGLCYSRAASKVFRKLFDDKALKSVSQDETAATYSLWRDEADYLIDWSQSAVRLTRFIDAVGRPYDGAKALLNGSLVKVAKAIPISDVEISNRAPGKVIWTDGDYPVVVCGEGLLKLLDVTDANNGENLLPLQRFRSRFS